eukprot:8226486-Alexandrium_andersonii.AAC.1
MSASLVGSEMCIRDSSGSAPAIPPGCPAPGTAHGPAPTAGRTCSTPTSCLLYTSDAADDM